MKKLALTFLAAAALAAPAEAACTKKSLNGSWAFGLGPTGYTGTMSGGVWFVDLGGGTSITITVASVSKSKCKGTGTLSITSGGTTDTYPAKFAMEHISESSSLKPNILHMTAADVPPVNYVLFLQRQ
jgi:hypothetical protein